MANKNKSADTGKRLMDAINALKDEYPDVAKEYLEKWQQDAKRLETITSEATKRVNARIAELPEDVQCRVTDEQRKALIAHILEQKEERDLLNLALLIKKTVGTSRNAWRIAEDTRAELKKDKYAGKSISELVTNGLTDSGVIENSLLQTLCEAVQLAITRPIKNDDGFYTRPIDPVNETLWTNAKQWPEKGEEHGKQLIVYAGKNRKTGEPVRVGVRISYYETERAKVSVFADDFLKPFDREIYFSLGNLYRQGYRIVTLKQIYDLIPGNTVDKLNEIQRTSILNSINKMLSMTVWVDTREEVEAFGKQYEFDGSELTNLLRVTINKKVIVNFGEGITVEIADLPALFKLGIRRNQILTYPTSQQRMPLRKEENNFNLMAYFITHIHRQKNKTFNMFWLTIYKKVAGLSEDEIEATDPKKLPWHAGIWRKRVKERVVKTLDYLKGVGEEPCPDPLIENYDIKTYKDKIKITRRNVPKPVENSEAISEAEEVEK